MVYKLSPGEGQSEIHGRRWGVTYEKFFSLILLYIILKYRVDNYIFLITFRTLLLLSILSIMVKHKSVLIVVVSANSVRFLHDTSFVLGTRRFGT